MNTLSTIGFVAGCLVPAGLVGTYVLTITMIKRLNTKLPPEHQLSYPWQGSLNLADVSAKYRDYIPEGKVVLFRNVALVTAIVGQVVMTACYILRLF